MTMENYKYISYLEAKKLFIQSLKRSRDLWYFENFGALQTKKLRDDAKERLKERKMITVLLLSFFISQ